MFFETRNDRSLPISDIKEIRFWRRDGNERIYAVEVKGSDNVFEISEDVREKILNMPVAFIAAQIGTCLIDANDPTSEPMMDDVVAWAISSDGVPTPVTIGGLYSGTTNDWAVLMPSGRVEHQGLSTYENVEQYVESVRTKAS